MRTIAILAALGASFQDPKPPSAEEFLKSVESLYVSAGTLKWKQSLKMEKIEGGASEVMGTGKIEAAFKKVNKVRFEMSGELGGAHILSDGESMRFNPGKRPLAAPTPKSLDANVRLIQLRAGFEMASLSRAIRQNFDADTVAKKLLVSDVRFGPADSIDGKEMRTVEYSLSVEVDDRKSVHKGKIWVDPGTRHIRRRVMDMAEIKVRVTEDYTDIELDGKIEDSHFKLPEEKK